MPLISRRSVGAVAALVAFTATAQVGASGPRAEAAGQQKGTAAGGQVGVEKVIAAWTFPGATAGKGWHNVSPTPKRLSPYIASRSTTKPYKEVWAFYAKKCGSDAQYERHEGGGGQDEKCSYSFLSRQGRGAERACFVRVVQGYAVTVFITKQKGGGADIDIVCIVR